MFFNHSITIKCIVTYYVRFCPCTLRCICNNKIDLLFVWKTSTESPRIARILGSKTIMLLKESKKLHRIKVNKSQKDFGKYFFMGEKTIFFRAKNLSVKTWRSEPDICSLICGCSTGRLSTSMTSLLTHCCTLYQAFF